MREIDIDAFVRKFAGSQAVPAVRRKPAAKIMQAPQPLCYGPRLEASRGGNKRWLTTIDLRPNFQAGYQGRYKY